jgi:hypothetical protein
VCVCVSPPPPSLLENGSVKVPLSLPGNGSVFYVVRVISKESRRLVLPTASCVYYEITLLSVCVHIIVSFCMRSVSYQRKVGDKFFPELFVLYRQGHIYHSVRIVTMLDLTTDESEFNSPQGPPYRLWGPPRLLSRGTVESSSRYIEARA